MDSFLTIFGNFLRGTEIIVCETLRLKGTLQLFDKSSNRFIYDEKNENVATYETHQNFMVYPNPYHKPPSHYYRALHECVFK